MSTTSSRTREGVPMDSLEQFDGRMKRRELRAKENARMIAAQQRVERARAVALVELSHELRHAADKGAPRWDKTATPKAHHAWDTAGYLTGLVRYVAGYGDGGTSRSELVELLDEGLRNSWLSTVAADLVASLSLALDGEPRYVVRGGTK